MVLDFVLSFLLYYHSVSYNYLIFHGGHCKLLENVVKLQCEDAKWTQQQQSECIVDAFN